MPAETHVERGPVGPDDVFVLVRERLAEILEIDEARINWYSGGSNYFGPDGLVSQAANEVGGNAFVTEYAGPSAPARSSARSSASTSARCATTRTARRPSGSTAGFTR